MSAKWGHDGASKDLARLAEQRGGWLGQQNRDTGDTDQPSCSWCRDNGDDRDGYPCRRCAPAERAEAIRGDLERLTDAALTPAETDERRAA